MAIVPTPSVQRRFRPNPVVTLEEYARLVGYSECAFFGIEGGPNHKQFECTDIWSLDQRNYLNHFLSEAQQEIEDEIGYFLSADWVVGQISDERDSLYRYVDQQTPGGVYRSRWKKVNQIGTRSESIIAANEPIDYTTDPAVIGPIATTVTDLNEIHVYHPGGSELEINPNEMILSGGFLTISIPRCRLKLEAVLDQTVAYTDDTAFEETVDVRRVYTDPTIQGVMLCSTCGNCADTALSGCLRILNERMGTLEFVDSKAMCTCGCRPSRIGLSYYSGDINVTQQSKDVVVRLAHSKSPEQMCGCNFALRLWQRDREIPEIITKDSISPWGINRGALVAWNFAKAMKSFSFGEI